MRAASTRISLLFCLVVLGTGCVSQRLKKEHRRPYSRRTSTLEDVAYTIESGAKKLGEGIAYTFTVGLAEAAIDGLLDVDDDDESEVLHRPPGYVASPHSRPPPPPPPPRRTIGRRRSVDGP